jgi:hypothetical protein
LGEDGSGYDQAASFSVTGSTPKLSPAITGALMLKPDCVDNLGILPPNKLVIIFPVTVVLDKDLAGLLFATLADQPSRALGAFMVIIMILTL